MADRQFQGIGAAPGIVSGRFRPVRPRAVEDLPTSTGGADELRAAIETCVTDLEGLLESCSESEAEIVEMHVAFLRDDELSRPAFETIAAGEDAAAAWRAALDSEIDEYRKDESEYFRARAADFEDIRDRVLDVLNGRRANGEDIPAGSIVVATELKPSEFLASRWAPGSAIVLAEGSPTSHVAMLARGRNVAMVVGAGAQVLASTGTGIVDGGTGAVIVAPDAEQLEGVRKRQAKADATRRRDAGTYAALPARTRDGTPVTVQFSVTDPADLNGLDPAHCDGIGLVRTELFLNDLAKLGDEDYQYIAYRRIVEWAAGRPVTFRTIDAGGDKPIEGYSVANEQNPFLGLRGIRLSLLNEALFRTQLRALLRASAHGNVRVMIPMVTVPDELAATRRILFEERQRLDGDHIPYGQPTLGVMVEVPTVAITPQRFDADFYSIGSNDLVQYICAASREQAACAVLAQPSDPAVLALISNVVDHGAATGKDVSLCGDAGGDPAMLPLLADAGLRSFSIQPALVGMVKAALAGIDLGRER